VLAFPVGGIPEAIVDGVSGRLVSQMNAAGLAQGMEELINNSILRTEMGTNGRNRVLERFDTLRTQRAIEKVYDELLFTDPFEESD
jgi:colanic acid/amylovoran biosynthesis glycosyltransferase